jgi:hypothetical protein
VTFHSSTRRTARNQKARRFAVTHIPNQQRKSLSAQPYARESTTLQEQASGDSHQAESRYSQTHQAGAQMLSTAKDRRASTVSTDGLGNPILNLHPCQRYMLWIDGVGAWQLCTGQRFDIGSPSLERRSADIALLANVSRQHASLMHSGSDWKLQAHQLTAVAGRQVTDSVVLRSGDQICLAERVKLGFRIPSPLSFSAVIDFESDHRPAYSVDGIILMTDHCLLGPRADQHVWCRHWPDMIVLFLQNGQLYCRSKVQLALDGMPAEGPLALSHGSVVTSEDMRFRVEQME